MGLSHQRIKVQGQIRSKRPRGIAFSHASRMAIASATISPWLADQNRVHASSDEFGARHSRREDHSELLPSGLPVIRQLTTQYNR
jgi:hypothetical protein